MGDPLQSHWVTLPDGRHVQIKGPEQPDQAEKEFKTIDDALAWGDERMNPHLTADDIQALDSYQDGGYTYPNSELRYGNKLKGEWPKYAKQLDHALQKYTVPENVITYRVAPAYFFDDLKNGAIFTDKGWCSTSLSIQHVAKQIKAADGEAMLIRFHVPKGMHAASLGSRGGVWRKEAELLLPRKTKWKVTRFRHKTYGWPALEMRPVL